MPRAPRRGLRRTAGDRTIHVVRGARAVAVFDAISAAEQPEIGLGRFRFDGAVHQRQAAWQLPGPLIRHRSADDDLSPIGETAGKRAQQQRI